MNVKKILKIIIVIMFVQCFFLYRNLLVHAESSNMDYINALAKEYTNSDKYVYDNTQIDIDNYKITWNGYDGVGRGAGYGQRNMATDGSYRIDDNDIVKIVPKDLFYQVGEYHYLGEEYGFYIYTEDLGYTYRSCVLVYDVDYTIPNYYTSTSTCEIRVLFQCWYDGMDRKKSKFGNTIVSGKDRAVAFLYSDDTLYLQNLTVGVDLKNRDNLNYGDENYQLVDYTNFDIIDNGDYISYQDGYVVPKEISQKLKSNKEYELNGFEQVAMIGMKNILSKIGLGAINWVEKIKYINYDEDSDGNFDAFRVLKDFASGYDQVLQKEEFVRGAVCTTKSNSNSYNPKICVGGKFIVTTKFEGPIKVYERNYMNLNYDLSITVINEKNNSASTVNKSREFTYSKKMNLANKEKILVDKIDHDLNNIAFFFRTVETQKLYFNVYSTNSITMEIYDNEGNKISRGMNSIALECIKNTSYIIIISGEKGSQVIFNISETEGKNNLIEPNDLNIVNLRLSESNHILNIGNEPEGIYCFDFKSCINANLLITIEDIDGNIIEPEFRITLEQKYFTVSLTNETIYIIKITSQEVFSGIIYINVFNMEENCSELSCTYGEEINLTNQMEENAYVLYKNLVYINTINSGFYNFQLIAKNEKGVEIILPENSINIYDYNDDKIESQYNVLGYSKLAKNTENQNGMFMYLSRKGYFYLHILIPNNNYSEIKLKIIAVDNQRIDIIDRMEDVFFETITVDNASEEYVKQLEIKQTAKYRINITTDLIDNFDNIKVLMIKSRYDSSSNTYYKIDQFCIQMDNSVANAEILLTPGVYYIGYFGNIDFNKISIIFERKLQIDGHSYSTLYTDPDTLTQCGSEVRLNNGLYRGNEITEGFTRCIYINSIIGRSNSRTDYYWYSSNENVASVSNYGTVLAKKVDFDIAIKIYAVYKSDPTIIFVKTFVIKKETKNEKITIQLKMNIDLGKIKSIELANSAPYNFLQYYSWSTSNSTIASVDLFGRVTGNSKGEATIYGKNYIYNDRIIIIIVVNVA